MITKKMPNCAAAPKMSRNGLKSSGPKSIMAPMPMKSSSGKSSVSIAHIEEVLEGSGLSDDARAGNVHQDGAEAHGHEQRGLVFLLDAKVHEDAADDHHDEAAGFGHKRHDAGSQHISCRG